MISRRGLFALAGSAAAAGLLGSCARPVIDPTVSPSRTRTPMKPATVASLLSDSPFYIAHRGGGRQWPEMTAYAYEQATEVDGVKALEMSVCLSRDGQLVLSHDPTTGRLTGTDLVIATTDWADLSGLEVSAAETIDPDQPSRPLSRFDDVVEKYIDRYVLFVEPKVSIAAQPLFTRLAQVGNSERIVWKQPINSALFSQAKEAGYRTWGYVLNEPAHTGAHLTRLAASTSLDMIGVEKNQSDALTSAVVTAAASRSLPVIMWAIGTNEERDRAVDRGATGIMCAAPGLVVPQPE